ncbi:hypothetical protein AB2B38_010320 [Balneola sp. MJW-20]
MVIPIMTLLIMISCDNSLQPIDNFTESYSIYGKLDLKADTNFIRVKDLNTPLLPEATETFEGEVVLQDVNAGTEEVLDFRRIRFEDIFVYNFFTTQAISGQNEYRLQVRKSGEVVSEITARTPEIAGINIQRESESCFSPITVRLDPVMQGEYLTVELSFVFSGIRYPRILPLSEQDRTDGIFEFTFTPQSVLDDIFVNSPVFQFGRVLCRDLSEGNIYMDIVHYGEGFSNRDEDNGLPVPGTFKTLYGLYSEEVLIPILN